jgi:heparan-alpha-glucosaminide N-acetyltransferase
LGPKKGEHVNLAVAEPGLATARPAGASPAARNVAIDAYRGFVMFLMMAEVLHLGRVARAFPDSGVWNFLAFHQSHVPWAGASLHDMIQPSFSFLVGVALPYSLARRVASGAGGGRLFLHALWRGLLLAWLGIFLRSLDSSQTNFTFEDTLTQIGLGYPFLFLLGRRSARAQWIGLGVVLFGYWLAWALYPVAGAYDYAAVGVPPDWAYHYTGFAAHWNKNHNLGHAFDVWFLNLFPRETPFVANGGGYLTLSFIPTLGTMILGLAAGRWLKAAAPRIPYRPLLVAAAACCAAGVLLHVTGLNPVVKRIWTPGWTLFSGGICFLFVAAFCYVIETRGWRRWAFPLVVIGMNSIAAYLIAHLFEPFIARAFTTHLGPGIFTWAGPGLEPFVRGWAVLLVFWLILFWMYRRKIFLRV